jgi:hypothetical protein
MSFLTKSYFPLKTPLPFIIPQNLLGFTKIFDENFVDLNSIEAKFLCSDSSLYLGDIDKICEDRFSTAFTNVANEFIRSFNRGKSFLEVHTTIAGKKHLYAFINNKVETIAFDQWNPKMKLAEAIRITKNVFDVVIENLKKCFVVENIVADVQFDLNNQDILNGLRHFFVYMTLGFTLTKHRYVSDFTKYLGQTFKQAMICMMPYFCLDTVKDATVLDASYFLAAALDVIYDHEAYGAVRKDADDRYQRLHSTYSALVNKVNFLPKLDVGVKFEVQNMVDYPQENLRKVTFMYGQLGSGGIARPPVEGYGVPDVRQVWGYERKTHGTRLGAIDKFDLASILVDLVMIANSKVVTPIPGVALKWMKSARITSNKEEKSWTLTIRYTFDSVTVQEYSVKSTIPEFSSEFYFVMFFEFFQFVLNYFNSGVKYAKLHRLGKTTKPFFVSNIPYMKQQAYAFAVYYFAVFSMCGSQSFISSDNYLGQIVDDYAARLRYYVGDRFDFGLDVLALASSFFLSRLHPFAVASIYTVTNAIQPFINRRYVLRWIRSFICWLFFQDVACYVSNIDEVFNRFQAKNVRDNVSPHVTGDRLQRLGVIGYLRVPELVDTYKEVYGLMFPIPDAALYGDMWIERMRFQRHVLVGASKQCFSCSRVIVDTKHSIVFPTDVEYQASPYYPPFDFGFPKITALTISDTSQIGKRKSEDSMADVLVKHSVSADSAPHVKRKSETIVIDSPTKK